MGAGFAAAAAAAFGLRGEPGRPPPHLREVGALLGNRRFLFILVFAPLHWAALTPYHGFLGILALDRGFARSTVGTAFFIAVLAEVAAFIVFPRLRRRFGLESLLAVMAAITAVRWLLLAGVPFGPPVAAVFLTLQVLHAASYGLYWASTMAWLADAIPPALRATGQALFTAVTFGLGNLLGFSACGRLYDFTGGAEAAFIAAAGLELIPLTMAVLALRHRDRSRAPS
jgi:MFS transporter, PPP family, 3-phenylpropionic acid transporter